MGQNVTVIEKPSSNPEIVRFEINRSLTGMGHERYGSVDDIIYDRAVDRLARSLFEAGGVDDVHVNSSVITVRLAGGSTGHGLADVIRNMFRFYGDDPGDGAALEADAADLAAEAEAEAEGSRSDDASATDGVTASESEAADVAEAPESAADHAIAAGAVGASAADAPGDAPEPQPGDRQDGQATAEAEGETTSNLDG